MKQHVARSARTARLAAFAFVIAAAIITACSSSKDDGSGGSGANKDGSAANNGPPRNIDVGLLLTGKKLELLGQIRHDDAAASAKPRKLTANDPIVFWELVSDATSKVIANGAALDPRRAITEFDANKKPAPLEVITQSGIFNVTVPNVGGTLHLYDSPRVKAPNGVHPLSVNGGGEIADPVPIPKIITDFFSKFLPDTSKGEQGFGLTKIIDNSKCGDDFVVLLVAEGYTDMAAFQADAAAAASQLTSIPGYAEHANQMTVYTQTFVSKEDGISDPDNKIKKDTAFNASFGKGDLRRCVYVNDGIPAVTSALLWVAKARTNADIIGMVTNTSEYGGCAGQQSGKPFITFTRDGAATQILGHEMGHGMFGLADEYDYGTCGAVGAPNTSNNLGALPWADMLTTKTLPTTDVADPATVGAYEGAQYCKKGAYRPSPNCKMKELSAEFCKVCLRRMDKTYGDRSTAQRKKTPECQDDAGVDAGGAADAGGGGELDAGGNADAGGKSDDIDLYDSCEGRADGVYCSQLVEYSAIVCEGQTIASGQQCATKCLGPNGPGTTIQCEGGGPVGPGGGDAAIDPTIDSCDGRGDGVYCSVVNKGFAFICTGGTVGGGLYCPAEKPNCTGPNGAGAQIQCGP